VGVTRTSRGVGVAWLAAIAVSACGGPDLPPGPGTTSGIPPDLRGRRVMVLPVQQNLGVRGDPDAELAFGLRERDVEVTWVLPDEIEEVLDRSPAVQASTRGLPVSQFLTAEVRRVGDPLYGDLRRLAALVNADAALIPVQASLEAEPDADPTVRLWTALIETRTGRVLWFSVLDGEAREATDPRGLASAVDRLAASLLWYAGV
jgi:hypothetical protein